jgi:dTMP kinase
MPTCAPCGVRLTEAARPAPLVTLEGIDGTGKSSVAAALGRWLEGEGVKAAMQREPTSSWVGEAVKRSHVTKADPLTHLFLFLADRAQHTAAMRAELAMGTTIVCDRYFDSTVAYQGAALRGQLAAAGLESVKWIRALHDPWVIVPDLTLLIIDDPLRCIERVKAARGRTTIFEDAAFLAKVQVNYRALAAAEPQRFKVIESGDLDRVKESCRANVEALLASRSLLKGNTAPA